MSMIMDTGIERVKKQANELSDKHGILQTYSILFVIKSAGEAANKVLLSVV